jgi:hypothetical protein
MLTNETKKLIQLCDEPGEVLGVVAVVAWAIMIGFLLRPYLPQILAVLK